MQKSFGYKNPSREAIGDAIAAVAPSDELETLRRRVEAYERAEAASVRVSLGETDELVVEIPTDGPPTARHPRRTYVQPVPCDERGLATILRVLRARRRASLNTYIGDEAAPTQSMVEQWIRQMGAGAVKVLPQGPGLAKPKATMELLGLTAVAKPGVEGEPKP